MRRTSLLLGSFAVLSLLTAVACDDGGSAGGAGGTSSSTTSSTKASTGASMTTTGASMTTTGSSMGSTGSTSSASSSASTGSGMMSSLDHLVFHEIVVGGDPAEFVEIWNPTNSAIDLSNYYISDNSTYWEVPAGMPWDPEYNPTIPGDTNPPDKGSDFLGGFPPGTTIPADGVITIAFKSGFEATYSKCPNFYVTTMPTSCGGNMVPPLRQPVAGSILINGNALPGLSNKREMLVLFTWDGTTGHTVKDVDYVVWGTTGDASNNDPGSRADKTGVAGYLPDTPTAMQKFAEAPKNAHAIVRTATTESAEKTTGGNGIGGHDETSEDFSMSFTDSAMPTPTEK
ncbi:MAG: lamin tail domain-containing protein [Polyangiaceae bacterium]